MFKSFKKSLSYFLLIFLLGLSFLSGCSLQTRKEIDMKKEKSPYLGVEVESVEEDTSPKIEEQSGPKTDQYGPLPLEGNKQSSQGQAPEPVVALYIGSGNYRTLASLGFFQKLLREDINIRIFSGEGFGALLASLFASEVTPERIEWLFFKFIKTGGNRELFYEDWRESLKETFYSELNYQNIDEVPIFLTLPVYSENQEKVVFRDSGELFSLLDAQFPGSQGNLKTPLDRSFRPIEELFAAGADLVVGLNVLGKKVSFVHGNDRNLPLYRTAMERLKKIIEEEKDRALFFDLSLEKIGLDTTEELPFIIQNGREAAGEAIPQLKALILQWKKDRLESDKS